MVARCSSRKVEVAVEVVAGSAKMVGWVCPFEDMVGMADAGVGVGVGIGVDLVVGSSQDSEDSSLDDRSNLYQGDCTWILTHLRHGVHLRHVVTIHRIWRCIRLRLHDRPLTTHLHRRRLTIRRTDSSIPLIMNKCAIVYFAAALRTSLGQNYLWKYLQGTVLNLSAFGTKVCEYAGFPEACWLPDRSALSLLIVAGICIWLLIG